MISASFGRSALQAVMTMSLGSEAGSTTSEWYRMPVTGLGMPSNSSSSSWTTSHVFPCMRRSARTTRAPNASPIAWCQRHQDAGFPRRAGAGREDDGGGFEREHLLHGERVVAVHHRLRPELAEQLDEVVGEGIVVVEDEQHGRKLLRRKESVRSGVSCHVKAVVQRGVDAPQAPRTGMHRAPQGASPCEQPLIASSEDFGVALERGGARRPDPGARDHLVAGPRGMFVVDFVPQHDPRD